MLSSSLRPCPPQFNLAPPTTALPLLATLTVLASWLLLLLEHGGLFWWGLPLLGFALTLLHLASDFGPLITLAVPQLLIRLLLSCLSSRAMTASSPMTQFLGHYCGSLIHEGGCGMTWGPCLWPHP